MNSPDTRAAFAIPCRCQAHMSDGVRPEPTHTETFGITHEYFADGSRRHHNKHGRCWLPEHAKDCSQHIAVMDVLRPIGIDGIRHHWKETAPASA